MNHPDDVEPWIKSLPQMPASEAAEIVLGRLNEILQGMSTETLRIFRAQCLELDEGDLDHDTVLEVVDGLLALREMGEA